METRLPDGPAGSAADDPRPTDRGEPPLALSLPGVVEFNATRWGLRSEVIEVGSSGSSSLTATVYAGRRGRLVQPPNTPYTPIEFVAPEGSKARRRAALWLELADQLAEGMRSRGVAGLLPLHPTIVDVRPWQWRGFEAQLRYTFILRFPLRLDEQGRIIRRRIRQAQDLGVTCRSETDNDPILACLRATEQRQGFAYGLSEQDLALARGLIGDDHLLMYTAALPNGDVLSARIVLHRPGALALDWVAGTTEPGLASGASKFLLQHVLTDLEARGSAGLDFCGANIRSVANEKSEWGGTLVPYPTVSLFGARSVAVSAKRWWIATRPRPR
ncbi:MAG TPA: GNAT family N-acetyltransferase [Actinomycetota bacterium]|jgi:hypothetical protein